MRLASLHTSGGASQIGSGIPSTNRSMERSGPKSESESSSPSNSLDIPTLAKLKKVWSPSPVSLISSSYCSRVGVQRPPPISAGINIGLPARSKMYPWLPRPVARASSAARQLGQSSPKSLIATCSIDPSLVFRCLRSRSLNQRNAVALGISSIPNAPSSFGSSANTRLPCEKPSRAETAWIAYLGTTKVA